MDAAQEYLSLKSLATYASLSVKTLRTYLTDPKNPLPHFKMTGKILVKRTDFDAWIECFRSREHPVDLDRLVDDMLSAVQSERGIVV
jgi:Helix-turn-helix domain